MFGERHLELPTTLLQHLYPNQGGWEELSFGLFGGIDIGCTCNVLRKHPIRLYIHTDRASIQQFCTLLQLPYFEQEIHSMQDVRSSIVMAMNTYPKTLLLVDGDVFLCLDSKARTLVALHTPEISIPIETILHRRTKIRMIALGEALDISKRELLLLSLASSIAHFHNRTGIDQQCQGWINSIRRPSIRKSWPKLLKKRDNYFWMAVQLYRQIISAGDIAHRERYVSFLRAVSVELEQPELSKIALQFRRSAEQWRRLAVSLIDANNSVLITAQKSRNLDSLLENFMRQDKDLDISLRMNVIERTIQNIIRIEKQAFAEISAVITPLSLSAASK